MIYFDNAATTAPIEAALKKYLDVSSFAYGNPQSRHFFGREADKILEEARKSMLLDLGFKDNHNLLFCSGATESNNLAIKGTVLKYKNRGNKIITSAGEHPSVLKTLDELAEIEGFDIVKLPLLANGCVSLEALKDAIDQKTILVSIMAVNNEVGAINDLKAIKEIMTPYRKALLHVDATQAVGKASLPFFLADLISFSGHKFGALKGCGALIYRKNIQFVPVNSGGAQESGNRAGTVNVAGAAAMSLALSIATKSMKKNLETVKEIRDYLLNELRQIEGVSVNSNPSCLPYVLSISLTNKKASVVVESLSRKGICVSTVSACSSKESAKSYVLEAMGVDKHCYLNPIRLSFSPKSTMEEAKTFVEEFRKSLEEVISL